MNAIDGGVLVLLFGGCLVGLRWLMMLKGSTRVIAIKVQFTSTTA